MKKFKTLVCIIPTLTIALTFFGCGNLIPYSMQPSYHEFKNMCELNKLPNNEEKYNKMLSYFGKSLDSLDYEMLDKKMKERKPIGIIDGKEAYITNPNQVIVGNLKNDRYDINLSFYTKDKKLFSRSNIIKAKITGSWNTRRYHLRIRGAASQELIWEEDYLTCSDIINENLEVLDDK